MAISVEFGPGIRFVAPSRSRNCCSVTQRRRRTSSSRMSAGDALMTWAVRRPAERWGPRAPLLTLVALSATSALLLLGTTWVPLVIVAAIVGTVAVVTGEKGPFLAIE